MTHITLKFIGPSYQAHLFPALKAEVVKETKSRITVRHPALGPGDHVFSRANGFRLGTSAVRGIGRSGYCLPDDQRIVQC